MSKKQTYTNRKKAVYYFREVTGRRGTRIACSTKKSETDLSAIPTTHEIAETPNGQVSCRKRLKSELLPEEIALTNELCKKLAKKNARIIVEVKQKALIIHSASTDSIQDLAKMASSLGQNPDHIQAVLEKNLYFEPMLKLVLSNKEERSFWVSRMCWIGSENDWLLLEEGTLKTLLKEYIPHVEQESFFEQM